MTVLSKQQGVISGRRWTYESISRGWQCEVIEPDSAKPLFLGWGELKLQHHGTLVVWDDLDWLRFRGADVDEAISHLLQVLPVSLGITFHRFIQSGRLALTFDVRSLEDDLDGVVTRFGAPGSIRIFKNRRSRLPASTFWVELGSIGRMKIRGRVWPKDAPDPGYKLGGGKLTPRGRGSTTTETTDFLRQGAGAAFGKTMPNHTVRWPESR